MNEFIELENEDGRKVLLSIHNVTNVTESRRDGMLLVDMAGGRSIVVKLTLSKLKKLLGLTKKR